MSELFQNIDARTQLAGTNKLEILLFSLGENPISKRRETYGINVFKVREVIRTPEITSAPGMPEGVEGMASLRGQIVPVINLSGYIHAQADSAKEILIVTEYNGHTQGFLVEGVDTILRLDWSQMQTPPAMLASTDSGGLVTAVTELQDGRLVMMLDVEKILSETTKYDNDQVFKKIVPVSRESAGKLVYYCDDSVVARNQVKKTLEALGIRGTGFINGKDIWTALDKLAGTLNEQGERVADHLALVLTDVEMPELDGYMLTKRIKSDQRFEGVPVVMHSSLSGSSNQQLGSSVGVNEYVSKFEAQKLADTVKKYVGA